MDPKSTWPVVKFIIAATGFNKQNARKLLEEIPKDCYADLFLKARAWDRDAGNKASEQLSAIVGGKKLHTLTEATVNARKPNNPKVREEDENGDDNGEERPRRGRRSK